MLTSKPINEPSKSTTRHVLEGKEIKCHLDEAHYFIIEFDAELVDSLTKTPERHYLSGSWRVYRIKPLTKIIQWCNEVFKESRKMICIPDFIQTFPEGQFHVRGAWFQHYADQYYFIPLDVIKIDEK